jgi:RHS repeat-associated protein
MPIDIATGNVEIARDDFSLPGRMPIKWTRSYRSQLVKTVNLPLGSGWTASWFPALKRVGHNWEFLSAEGLLDTFPDPDGRLERGHVIRLLGAFMELLRQGSRYIVTGWDVESGEIKRFVFAADPVGNATPLVSVEDVAGNGVELSWEPSGQLKSLRQRTEERTVLVNCLSGGQISSLSLVTKSGAPTLLVRYEYDIQGRLVAAIDRRGLANRYEYDEHSRVRREILKDGAVYSYRYDNIGRCIHFTGLDHYNEKRLCFLDAANRTTVTNSYGKTSVFEWLPNGQIVSELDPAGNQSRTGFDEYGRIVSKVDPMGATTRYTYDEQGNRDSITDPLGNAYGFKFNAFHQVVLETDPLGKSWHREYDSRHRLVATRDPLGARWKIDYDEGGNPAVITDPLGSSRRRHFVQGLVCEMTDWMGHVTQFRWDEFGRVVERLGPTGARTAFQYDPVGNPTEVECPDGACLRASYDSGDNLSTFTKAKGHTTRFRYGPCRRLFERVDALGRVVRYVWGTEVNRLDSVINEKGETFTYFHDDLGRIIRERSFDGREQSFEYDAAGRCVAVINFNGEKIQLKRDVVGRLSEKALPEGAVTKFEYDAIGRIAAAISPDIPIQFEYDDAGRVIREIQGQQWVQNDYNLAGEIIRTATSLGHEVRYDLDPNGRVRKLCTANEKSIVFDRDPRGLETARQMPGAMRLEQHYDTMGRLIQQRIGQRYYSPEKSASESRIDPSYAVVNRNYRYDVDGLLLSIADSRRGSTDYAYDPAERLLSALHERGLNEQFEYDATDNLARKTHQQRGDLADQVSTYGPGNRLLESGGTRYEYDQDGRLVRKTEEASRPDPHSWEYSWNTQGQLRKIRRPDGQEWEYKYDAFGRRVTKRGPTTGCDFLWDGDVIIQEIPHRGRAAAWITMRGSFAPLAKVRDGILYPIITDHLGTPREMLDSSGKLVWATFPTAWGQIERKQNDQDAHDCPIRFQGQWFDEESGLSYNRFRYYDPADGRFVSPDPIGLAGGRNFYEYVANPITWIDPLGLAKGSGCKDEKPGEPEKTPRAARREAMRKEGIPTSQQPFSQSSNESGREYQYRVPRAGGDTEIKSVQQQTMDSSHPGENHWEAGSVKVDPVTGDTRMNDYGRPKLVNDKSKVDYP